MRIETIEITYVKKIEVCIIVMHININLKSFLIKKVLFHKTLVTRPLSLLEFFSIFFWRFYTIKNKKNMKYL